MRLSVVIPCYNEVDNLPEVHRRVGRACSEAVGNSYEIVLVNDGSSDNTQGTQIVALCASDPHLVLLDLSRNYGHQIALSAGLEFCRGERVLILDADLQTRPSCSPR